MLTEEKPVLKKTYRLLLFRTDGIRGDEVWQGIITVMFLGGKQFSQCFKILFSGHVYSVLSGKRLS